MPSVDDGNFENEYSPDSDSWGSLFGPQDEEVASPHRDKLPLQNTGAVPARGGLLGPGVTRNVPVRTMYLCFFASFSSPNCQYC